MHINISGSVFTGLFTVLLSACASQVPLTIREAPADNPTLAQVVMDDASYTGRTVRWGGTIIETDNREDATRLIVLGKQLNRDGSTKFTDDSEGRFLAIVPDFLDPKVYATDRDVTFTGTVAPAEQGMVGEYPYTYPVIQAKAWYLWPGLSAGSYYSHPWHHWPWYDPWYPYGYRHRYRYRDLP